MAAEDLVRSHPFAFKKDSTLGRPQSTATSLAVHSAERGEGCAIIVFAPENRPIYRVTILHVTRYQLMIWMGTSGHLIPAGGLSRCDRAWFGVTRDARRVTLLHLQKRVTRCLQRVAPFSGHPTMLMRFAVTARPDSSGTGRCDRSRQSGRPGGEAGQQGATSFRD
jgi:hypothetical protein